ncbi:CGNR zinc finger domain-containing protein [Streptomyces sp. NPDC026672]|uniref:CGNR zinc finger domain-containing protein n=1 Tax=unclassified Streptomyces TaxID=2593676 RepID=UPI0033D5FEBA
METSTTAASSVPESARILIEIANSRELSVRPDLLEGPPAVAFLRELSLLREGVPLDEAALEDVRRFRDVLNRLLVDRGDADAWQRLNALAREVSLRAVFSPDEVELVAEPGADRPVGDLVIHLHRVIGDGSWLRVRLCANDTCAAAFYDATRSRTQRWHSYADCGNKSNVAAHRARVRSAGTH